MSIDTSDPIYLEGFKKGRSGMTEVYLPLKYANIPAKKALWIRGLNAGRQEAGLGREKSFLSVKNIVIGIIIVLLAWFFLGSDDSEDIAMQSGDNSSVLDGASNNSDSLGVSTESSLVEESVAVEATSLNATAQTSSGLNNIGNDLDNQAVNQTVNQIVNSSPVGNILLEDQEEVSTTQTNKTNEGTETNEVLESTSDLALGTVDTELTKEKKVVATLSDSSTVSSPSSTVEKTPLTNEVSESNVESKITKPVEKKTDLTDKIRRFAFSSDIEEREPVDKLPSSIRYKNAIFFFTEIKNYKGNSISHQWFYKGKYIAEKRFDEIQGNRWRLYSRKRILLSQLGEWTVRVVNQHGEILLTYSIIIGP